MRSHYFPIIIIQNTRCKVVHSNAIYSSLAEYSKIFHIIPNTVNGRNRTTQHNTTQHNTTQHNTTQHNTTQYNTIQQNKIHHNQTTQHNTTQHNTTQHNTTKHNTTQHNTIQHNTLQTLLENLINCRTIERCYRM